MAAGKKWDDQAVAAVMKGVAASGGPARWEVEGPKGWKLKTDGSKGDNADGLEALKALLQWAPGASPAAPPPQAEEPHERPPTLGEAMKLYEATEVPTLKPDTWQQRERSIKSFIQMYGENRRVTAVTRQMAARWAADLQKSGLSKRYVANTVSHVAQLFEAQIRAGHFAPGTNPVKGVVVFKSADKKMVRASGRGWEAFELPTLKRIFDPQNFARAGQAHVRWGALIGLYTGARVAEISQIYLRDFQILSGVHCVYLTDDNDGQSLKNDQSRRLVPLHPDLLKLGLWERVEALREAGETRLFPKVKLDGRSGPGNALSKGFSYLLTLLDIKPRRAEGTVGFHSLRKSVIHELQGSRLPAERRRALVGHETGDDVHAEDYMRPWRADELAEFFPGLTWGAWLDFPLLRRLLVSLR
jgi:integrase